MRGTWTHGYKCRPSHVPVTPAIRARCRTPAGTSCCSMLAVSRISTPHAGACARTASLRAWIAMMCVPPPPYFDDPKEAPFPLEPSGEIRHVLVCALGFGGQAAALVLRVP